LFFRNQIMQAVFIRHENAKVLGQLGQLPPDDPLVFENGMRGRIQWLAENEQADGEAGKTCAESPGKLRQPIIGQVRLRGGAAQLHADARREIFPIIFRSLRQRNGFQFRFEFKIVHCISPVEASQRLNFLFAANTRHEIVVSEQRETFAASA
jgi:hypothetical protein